MIQPASSRWETLFDLAVAIIDQANSINQTIDHWSFGGGTALMIHIDIQPGSYISDSTTALKTTTFLAEICQ